MTLNIFLCVQDGQGCVVIEGEHKLLARVQAELVSLTQSIKSSVCVKILKLSPVGAAVFKQPALTSVGRTLLDDAKKADIWCEVEGSATGSEAAAGLAQAGSARQHTDLADVVHARLVTGTGHQI